MLQQMQQTSATDCLRGRPNQHKSIGRPRFLAAGIAKPAVQVNQRFSILPNRNRRAHVAKLFEVLVKQRFYSVTKTTGVQLHERIGTIPNRNPNCRAFLYPRRLSGLTQKRYSKSSCNSSTRCPNNCSVLSIGAGVVMSTPAAFKVSSGNLEPPERKNFK